MVAAISEANISTELNVQQLNYYLVSLPTLEFANVFCTGWRNRLEVQIFSLTDLHNSFPSSLHYYSASQALTIFSAHSIASKYNC